MENNCRCELYVFHEKWEHVRDTKSSQEDIVQKLSNATNPELCYKWKLYDSKGNFLGVLFSVNPDLFQ